MQIFRLLTILPLAFLFVNSTSSRADGTLVTDISSHLISVTSDFTGTELLLFGAIQTDLDEPGGEHGDIIVVVRGPQQDIIVRKKERVAGIWANTQAVEIPSIPGFYAVASNRPVAEITDMATLERLRIGPARLSFEATNLDGRILGFKSAVIRQQSQDNLYSTNESSVYFLGNSLFRTSIYFPANVPVGNYIAEVYLFAEGELISAQTSPLFIKKFGIGRQIYEFAHNYPYIHGIAAILISLLAGWIASAIFRKD